MLCPSPDVWKADVEMIDNDRWRAMADPMPPTVRLDQVDPRPVVVTDPAGVPILAVARFPTDALAEYRAGVRGYPCDSDIVRSAGIRNRSRVIGYVGRSGVLRRAACAACSGATDHAVAHGRLAAAAEMLASLLAAVVPEQYERNRAAVAGVLPEWLLPGGLWTSGVLNETSQLPYHRDRNNFPGAWSTMPVVRRHTRGGHLHLPEIKLADGSDVVLALDDGDIAMFEGTRWMHGVTPIRKIRPDGYRYSCVYYPVRRFAGCLPWAEERARGLASRIANEDTLIARQRASGYLRAETESLGVHAQDDDDG
jgi:hypothetical protein